jgi:hypothetical protein
MMLICATFKVWDAVMGFDMQRRLGPGGLLMTCVFDVGRGVPLIITSVILLGE